VSRHNKDQKGDYNHGVSASRGHIDKKMNESEHNRQTSLERLTTALNALQIAVLRRFSLEKRQKSLEADLARMEEKQTQLIQERDHALDLCAQLHTLHDDLSTRLQDAEKMIARSLEHLDSLSQSERKP
jgi:hypothetical protein